MYSLIHAGQQGFTSARMRTGDHLSQVRDLDARVALGRPQGGVAEQGLDVADVGAALEQVRRDGVAEGVAGDVLLDAGLLGPALDDVVDARHGASSPPRSRGRASATAVVPDAASGRPLTR